LTDGSEGKGYEWVADWVEALGTVRDDVVGHRVLAPCHMQLGMDVQVLTVVDMEAGVGRVHLLLDYAE